MELNNLLTFADAHGEVEMPSSKVPIETQGYMTFLSMLTMTCCLNPKPFKWTSVFPLLTHSLFLPTWQKMTLRK
jgi:hypothetical protein